MNMQKPTGPLGNKRGIGFGILMTIVTLGIYCYWWWSATFEELKSHRNGQGIGGLIALILMFVGGSIAIRSSRARRSATYTPRMVSRSRSRAIRAGGSSFRSQARSCGS